MISHIQNYRGGIKNKMKCLRFSWGFFFLIFEDIGGGLGVFNTFLERHFFIYNLAIVVFLIYSPSHPEEGV